jgi:hypothetical protein
MVLVDLNGDSQQEFFCVARTLRRSILSSPYCHVTRETNNYAKGGVTREPNTYASQSGI